MGVRGDLHSHLCRNSDPGLNARNQKNTSLTKGTVTGEIAENLSLYGYPERSMARHNREGTGEDQLGRNYVVSYQPDWFYQVKVTRDLESGRQSTKTLFRNPETPQAEPGPRVRTRISSAELGIDFEITIEDPRGIVRRITVETVAPEGPDENQNLGFTITRTRPRRGSR